MRDSRSAGDDERGRSGGEERVDEAIGRAASVLRQPSHMSAVRKGVLGAGLAGGGAEEKSPVWRSIDDSIKVVKLKRTIGKPS